MFINTSVGLSLSQADFHSGQRDQIACTSLDFSWKQNFDVIIKYQAAQIVFLLKYYF